MQLAGWLRATVWRADDWRAALGLLLEGSGADGDPAQVLDLARALEHVEPDRRIALGAYVTAWRKSRTPGALAAARRIATEVRAHDVAAELAAQELERTDDPAWLVHGACAWIDAGQVARATRLLGKAAQAMPDDEQVRSLRQAAAGELRDPRAEMERWVARATERDEPAAAVHAARVARLGGLPEDARARLLRVAIDRWPADDEVAALVEDVLVARGDADDLLTFYRLRLGTRPNPRAWADAVRAAASRLCVRGVSPGLGLRLIRRGLEHAYTAGLVDIPGHLASWSLLVDHARSVRATRELMPLAVRALGLPLSDDDRLWLARLGLEVAWRDAGDVDAAAAYAAIVIELAPDHHDVREFVAQEIEIEIDVDGDDETPLVDDDITELAMSLVYLDEHGDRDSADVEAARAAASAAEAAQAGGPHSPTAPAAWLTPKTTARLMALAVTEAGHAAAKPARDPAHPERGREAAESSPAHPERGREAAESKDAAGPPRPGPVIPASALAVLRRIGARVREPTGPHAPHDAPRRAPRVVVPVDVTVELDDGAGVQAVVRDISTTGLFVVLSAELAIGAELKLELRLPTADDLGVSHHAAWGRVVRKADGGYGLELLDPAHELVEAILGLAAYE